MKIETTVTYLAMRTPSSRFIKQSSISRLNTEIKHWEKPNVEFYRFLYNNVGGPWTWVERRLVSDQKLIDLISPKNVEIHLLYVDAKIAGFSEIVWSLDEKYSEIKYFGLMPDFIGLGLGRYFLTNIINIAWKKATKKVTVNTCDLDHPKAVGLYLSCGFQVVKKVTELLPNPAEAGLSIPQSHVKRHDPI
tara:strand:+ start:762 stop:1334 length:573 start_codon:yes stop_codon:yes gene_type:complete